MIDLHDEVGIGVQSTCVLERRNGNNGSVRCWQREVKKERSVLIWGFSLFDDVTNGLFE